MNVREIVKAWLKEHGYDGLYDPDGFCGCPVDDLACAGDMCSMEECKPGYKVKCPKDECDCGDWHIEPKRQEGTSC
jgi:hypothetical protein